MGQTRRISDGSGSVADLRRSTGGTALAGLLVLVVALAGCTSSGGGGSPGGAASPGGTTGGSSHGSKAADYLPTSWPFPANDKVSDIDLVKWADPVNQAIKLVKEAMTSNAAKTAPRAFGDEPPERAVNKFSASIYLAAVAIRCLHQNGHLEFHGYIDQSYPYSASVVLVVDTKAYADLNVAWCALTDFWTKIVLRGQSAKPALSPCVGLRRQGSFVIAWLASTDWMCSALQHRGGGEVRGDPARELHRHDAGTDVAHVQFLLNQVGFDLAVDGAFGPATESALASFQACYSAISPADLSVGSYTSGVANQPTKDALKKAEYHWKWSREQCPSTQGG